MIRSLFYRLARILISILPTKLLIRRLQKKRGLAVLMYHSVSDDPEYRNRVSVKAFCDQMKFLSNYFDIVSLDEKFVRNIEIKRYDSGSRPKVLVTFDDGFKDNITNVLPIIERYKVPIAIFICTELTDSNLETFATWNELSSIASNPYVSFGSHGLYHFNVRAITNNDMRRGLAESKQIIEEKTEKPVVGYAYPGGTYSADKAREVMKYYPIAFKVDYLKRPFNERFAVGRLGIGSGERKLKGFIIKLCLKPFIAEIS